LLTENFAWNPEWMVHPSVGYVMRDYFASLPGKDRNLLLFHLSLDA